MTTLQNDLLEIYNSLVIFNKETIKTQFPSPIKVWYEGKESNGLLAFQQKGNIVRLWLPKYYCLDLDELEGKHYSYLTPEGYDELMFNLQRAINSGELIKDRTCLSPENLGFDIYATDISQQWKGPDFIASMRFVSGKGFLYRWWIEHKYNL